MFYLPVIDSFLSLLPFCCWAHLTWAFSFSYYIFQFLICHAILFHIFYFFVENFYFFAEGFFFPFVSSVFILLTEVFLSWLLRNLCQIILTFSSIFMMVSIYGFFHSVWDLPELQYDEWFSSYCTEHCTETLKSRYFCHIRRLLFKYCVLVGFFWHCSGKERGRVPPLYCQVEATVQFCNLVYINTQGWGKLLITLQRGGISSSSHGAHRQHSGGVLATPGKRGKSWVPTRSPLTPPKGGLVFVQTPYLVSTDSGVVEGSPNSLLVLLWHYLAEGVGHLSIVLWGQQSSLPT